MSTLGELKAKLGRARAPIAFLIVLSAIDVLVGRAIVPSPTTYIPWIQRLYAGHGYWMLIPIATLENIVGVGVYFPGSLVIIAGMAAAWGDFRDVAMAWLAIVAGGMIGQAVSYSAGILWRSRKQEALGQDVTKGRSGLSRWTMVASFAHPHLAGTTAFVSGCEGVSASYYFLIGTMSLAVWYVFWTLVSPLMGVALHEWDGLRALLYAYGFGWAAWKAGWLEKVKYSIAGTTMSAPTRPELTDAARAKMVGWGNIGAFLTTSPVYWVFLRGCYESWVGTVMKVFAVVQIGVALVCFIMAAGGGLFQDWQVIRRGAMGEGPFVRADTQNTRRVLRVVVAATMAWIGALIYVTGGLVGSAFASLGVTVIVLGQFLSSTEETEEAIVFIGVVFYAITEFALPMLFELPQSLSTVGVEQNAALRRLAYWLITVLSIMIGYYARVQTTRARATVEKQAGGRGQ